MPRLSAPEQEEGYSVYLPKITPSVQDIFHSLPCISLHRDAHRRTRRAVMRCVRIGNAYSFILQDS
jgi:hypothetical protein